MSREKQTGELECRRKDTDNRIAAPIECQRLAYAAVRRHQVLRSGNVWEPFFRDVDLINLISILYLMMRLRPVMYDSPAG